MIVGETPLDLTPYTLRSYVFIFHFAQYDFLKCDLSVKDIQSGS